jgi:putative oxidoreductase
MTDIHFTPYAALVLRLSLGTMFISHGLLKVFVYTLPGTAQFFDSVGLAGWMAYPVTILEIIGGALLVMGIAARLVYLLLLPVVLGAMIVHIGNGWLFTNPKGGWEYPAFLTMMTIVQALLGAGECAVKKPIPKPQINLT